MGRVFLTFQVYEVYLYINVIAKFMISEKILNILARKRKN